MASTRWGTVFELKPAMLILLHMSLLCKFAGIQKLNRTTLSHVVGKYWINLMNGCRHSANRNWRAFLKYKQDHSYYHRLLLVSIVYVWSMTKIFLWGFSKISPDIYSISTWRIEGLKVDVQYSPPLKRLPTNTNDSSPVLTSLSSATFTTKGSWHVIQIHDWDF